MSSQPPGSSEHRREWEEMAGEDAMWAILSYSDRKYGQWDRDAFFRTGDVEVEELMTRVGRLERPADRASALDFGCGLGRVTRALGRHFDACLGLDISPRMVAKAQELNADQQRCTFAVNQRADVIDQPDASFDFIYTRIVLQHLPGRAAIDSYLAEFVRTLRPGGLLVFQLPSSLPLRMRIQPRRFLYRALRSTGMPSRVLYWRLGLHPMRMRHVPVHEVTAFLQSRGATVLDVDTQRNATFPFEDSIYYATVG